MVNSKGEKGCESPIGLWVTRRLLIFLAVVRRGEWSPPSVGVFDIHRFLEYVAFD